MIREQAVNDLKRSYLTYSDSVDDAFQIEFNKFKKSFILADYTSDIVELLDEEPDISRHYAELVPIKMVPEEFWSRYFFKLEVLLRGGGIVIDDDDEDETEIQWESPIETETDNLEGNNDNNKSDASSFNNNKKNDDKNYKKLIEKEKENHKIMTEFKEIKSQLLAAKKEIEQLKKTNKSLQDTINILSNQPVEPKTLFNDNDTSGCNNEISNTMSSSTSNNDHNDQNTTHIESRINTTNDDGSSNGEGEDDGDDRVDLLSNTDQDRANASIDKKEEEEEEITIACEVAAAAATVSEVKKEDVALAAFDEEDEDEEWS